MAHNSIQGPAIFLAQFAGDTAPFNTLRHIARRAAGLGYKGCKFPARMGAGSTWPAQPRARPAATRAVHPACIDLHHDRIKDFHIKDAEFHPNGHTGLYGGFQKWQDRAGRFRSLGDGQMDFRAVFSKFTQYGYRGWAVLEWECCTKHPEQGAAEGAPFITDHLIRVAERALDDFAASGTDAAANRRMLNLQ